jgi:hypothetical protein
MQGEVAEANVFDMTRDGMNCKAKEGKKTMKPGKHF